MRPRTRRAVSAFARWIPDRATDDQRGAAALKGGIPALVETAHLSEAFGMSFEIHHGGDPLANRANLPVAPAIRTPRPFEVCRGILPASTIPSPPPRG